MLSRRTFFRRLAKTFAYPALIWIILAIVWLALPSPVPDAEYSQTTLDAGRTLTRVFELSHFFPSYDRFPAVIEARSTGNPHMIIEFELLEPGVLSLQGGQDFIGSVINPSKKPLPPIRISLSQPNGLSEPLRISSNTANVQDLPITPNWISDADRALLSWWFTRRTTVLTLRTRYQNNKVEIWPDSSSWKTGAPPATTPLLTIEFSDDQSPIFTFPELPTSSSPSKFHKFRLVVLFLIVPISLFLAVSFFVIALLAKFIYSLVQFLIWTLWLALSVMGLALGAIGIYVFVWWMRNGRPSIPFREISEAVAAVVHRPAAVPVVEETVLVDLEAQVATSEPNVSVDNAAVATNLDQAAVLVDTSA
ncbi:hypothetical protein C8J56DRAFT_1039664 [Mycena floridula]|nr:hypothetical protein C8J56DRAFT_1039664 [Mycena floridula]